MRIPSKSELQNWFKIGRSESLGNGRFFELIIEACYNDRVAVGDAVFDGGANRGYHTIPMANLAGETGLVIACEAIPALSATLATTCAEAGLRNVKIVNKALGASAGLTQFCLVEGADGYSGIRQRDGIPEKAEIEIKSISVLLTTMDIEWQSLGRGNLRFVKLDLEGGEYHALLGARMVMITERPFIVFENGRESSARTYGYDKERWFDLFSITGYRVFDLFGNAFTIDRWQEQNIPWYFIAVSRQDDLDFVSTKLPCLIRYLVRVLSADRRCRPLI